MALGKYLQSTDSFQIETRQTSAVPSQSRQKFRDMIGRANIDKRSFPDREVSRLFID